MKEQRWPGDYQTKEQQFASARAEENQGMRVINRDLGHDFIAYEQPEKLDAYQKEQLEMSACSMLDRVGMQPHAREYIEHELNYCRSERKYQEYEGGSIDHPDGIQFRGTP